MKIDMLKAEIFVFHGDLDAVMLQLQTAGLVHLEVGKTVVNHHGALHVANALKNAQRALELLTPAEGLTDPKEVSQVVLKEAIAELLELRTQKQKLQNKKASIAQQLERARPWGNFGMEHIQVLRKNGIEVRFFHGNKTTFDQFDFGKAQPVLLSTRGRNVYFATIGPMPASFPFMETPFEQAGTHELESQLKEIETALEDMDGQIRAFMQLQPALVHHVSALSDELRRREAMESLQKYGEGSIRYLKAWLPAQKQDSVESLLRHLPIGYSITKPALGDKVPVILRNNAYIRLFEPITKIFQLPNYHEFDLTPFIAFFYPIFFAYCLGDAGYGAILLVACWVAYFKLGQGQRGLAVLGMILGGLTTVMGLVKSGSLFGIALAGESLPPSLQFLGQFVVIPDDQDYVFNAFNVALMVGVFQILTAIVISLAKALRYDSVWAALFPLGKLLIVVSSITVFLGGSQGVALFEPWVPVAQGGLATGVVLVLLFHNLSLGIPLRIGEGFLPLFFIFTGILGDTLSYVRLFALGVASSVLGLVVNQIGMQMATSPAMYLVAGLFLVFGHGLNFGLAVLGAYVHSLRLTFVEFYNNATFKGGGIPFTVFRKTVDAGT